MTMKVSDATEKQLLERINVQLMNLEQRLAWGRGRELERQLVALVRLDVGELRRRGSQLSLFEP